MNWDLIGLTVVLALVGWVVISSLRSGGSATPIAGLLIGCLAAYVVGRISGVFAPMVVPLVIVAVALALFVRSPDQILSSRPLSGTFGYVNAKSALFVQATFAALMLVPLAGRRSIRAIGVFAAIACAIVPFLSSSLAAAGTVLLLPPTLLVLARARGIGTTALFGGGVFLAVLAATILLGAMYPQHRVSFPVALREVMSERRLMLWNDALDEIVSHPGFGVGAGHFRFASDTARSDPDARWAHNEFLEIGAETGILGGLLVAALFIWGFVRLSIATGRWSSVALGIGALTALGIQACVDYILHFPAIPIVAAALVGVACVGERGPFLQWPKSSRVGTLRGES